MRTLRQSLRFGAEGCYRKKCAHCQTLACLDADQKRATCEARDVQRDTQAVPSALCAVLSYVDAALDVTAIHHVNHLTTGGLVISAFGSNFTSSAAARAGRTACEWTAWVSSSSVQCAVPGGIFKSLAATVSIAGGVVTMQAAVSYNAPALQETTHSNTNNNGGGTMTVNGRGFGTGDYSVSSALDSTAAASTSWHSDTTMLCKAAAGTAGSFAAIITAGVGVGTLSDAASYDAIGAVVLSPQNARPGGVGASTLSGTELGRHSVSLGAAQGSTACASTWWVAATAVMCHSGGGVGSSSLLKVTVGQRVGTVSQAVTWDSAEPAASLVTNTPAGGQQSVTVTGSGLGAGAGTLRVSVASACEASTWASASHYQRLP